MDEHDRFEVLEDELDFDDGLEVKVFSTSRKWESDFIEGRGYKGL